MRLTRTALLLISIGACWSGSLSAQAVYEGCRDYRGIPVLSIRDESAGMRIAVAGYAPDGRPTIRYSEGVLRTFHPRTRLFWYAHECAHHALGHGVYNIPTLREKEADCWAIHTLTRAGIFDEEDVRIVQRDLSKLPGDGWVYLPGPQRGVSAASCAELNAGGSDPGTEARAIDIEFDSWPEGYASLTVYIDGHRAGSLENDGWDYLTIESIRPGRHTFELKRITLYDTWGRAFNRGGFCRGQFEVNSFAEEYELILIADLRSRTYRCSIS